MTGWQRASLAGWLLATATALWGCGAAPVAAPAPLPAQAPRGSFEVIARLDASRPTGVAISQENRTFLCYPRSDDGMLHTVDELLPSGKAVYYPDMHYNQPDPDAPADSLFSVQGLVVDARNRLWLLDTGRIRWSPVVERAAKLVVVDLYVNKVAKTFVLPADVLRPASYLNDLCVDLKKGTEGVAYITDSGVGAIIVVDLATGRAMRRLDGHPSTQAQEVQLVVEGQPLYMRPSPGESPASVQVAADGIALSRDGDTLYYCPLSSRRLYCVPTSALLSPRVTEDELAAYVRDLGPKPVVDGMIMDERGVLYLSAVEHNAIMRRLPTGTIETVVQDPRLLWPDSFAIGPDGGLYAIVNQLHRHGRFQGGADRKELPFLLVRIPPTAPAE
jgi:sugar lactone lactonase YvrE